MINLVVLALVACLSLMMGGCSSSAARPNQKTFADPQTAVQSLLSAAKKGDTAELLTIFGPEGGEILSSGDPIADKNNREAFVVALEQKWTLQDYNNSKELVIGYEEWPFPVPLVQESYGWRFDTAAGKQEVLARRIGRNELAAIGVCQTYLIAQKEYASEGRDGKPAGIYAQKVRSDPGKHDGLYWATTTPGEKRSPLGDLAAQAESQGYATPTTAGPRPFNGYYFRILTEQGKDARGGAKSYLVNGEMKDGFALIAYPAEYGNSGIMTFIVNQDGIIHEADLGDHTAKIAGDIKSYNPDSNWHPVK